MPPTAKGCTSLAVPTVSRSCWSLTVARTIAARLDRRLNRHDWPSRSNSSFTSKARTGGGNGSGGGPGGGGEDGDGIDHGKSGGGGGDGSEHWSRHITTVDVSAPSVVYAIFARGSGHSTPQHAPSLSLPYRSRPDMVQGGGLGEGGGGDFGRPSGGGGEDGGRSGRGGGDGKMGGGGEGAGS
eukprot:7377101-Prymnesium_polylepis.2